MPTYRFTINGLRHHDYADCLDRFFLVALGRRVTLTVEHDNSQEKDAVIAHLGLRCLGYVRSSQRAVACALIRAQEGGTLQGRIVEADRLHRWVTLEVTTECPVPPSSEVDRLPLLADWDFDGPVLLEEELDLRLRAMLSNLLMIVKRCEPWKEDVEEWLQYVEEELWRDISRETSEQAARLLLLLTGGATRRPIYADKALRLQLAIERMGSPEVRRRQVRHIVEEARSRRMNLLLCQYGPGAADALLRLPTELARLFLSDSELLMARLWYLHLPRRQVRALLTLLSLMVRLQGVPVVDGENAADAEGADGCRKPFTSSRAKSRDLDRTPDYPQKDSSTPLRSAQNDVTELCASVTPCSAENVELFHFIHPSLDDVAAGRLHDEVVRLCRRFGIQDICAHLDRLAAAGKLLLPQNARTTYDELSRLGMPASMAGFDYKTFMKYYRK